MAKPTLFFKAYDATTLITGYGDLGLRNENLWTDLAGFGSKLTGSVDSSIGINLGDVTNLSESGWFGICITHDAINPLTNVMFYFQPTTNERFKSDNILGTEPPGFTHSGVSGAADDFTEIIKWGDEGNNSAGMYMQFYHQNNTIQSTDVLKTGIMDSLANKKQLTNDGRFGPGFTKYGVTDPTYGESVINPHPQDTASQYISGDAAVLRVNLSVPDIEEAGIRQISLYSRITYTF